MSSLTAHLVHGMGTELVAADWPALTLAEADALLSRFPEAGGAAAIDWLSPRPLSAAALVRTRAGGEVFVKRHHAAVRPVDGLLEEHAFIDHLGRNGAPVVRVLRDADGASATASPVGPPNGRPDGAWTYEVHSLGEGEDLYRDAVSWSPFTAVAHARAAGRALARIHAAARGFDAPARAPRPLVGGFSVFAAEDPIAALERFAGQRPHVAAELRERPWRADFERWHLPFHERLRQHTAMLAPLWTHNDLHASNLLWRGGEVATVIDFGLADRAFAVHDLATAIERNAIDWLALEPGPGRDRARVPDDDGDRNVHADAAVALIEGYLEQGSLSGAERAALPELLPLCHADFALSEIDYFRGVTHSPQNTELAYRYLVDHTAWFTSPSGRALLDRIRRTVDG